VTPPSAFLDCDSLRGSLLGCLVGSCSYSGCFCFGLGCLGSSTSSFLYGDRISSARNPDSLIICCRLMFSSSFEIKYLN